MGALVQSLDHPTGLVNELDVFLRVPLPPTLSPDIIPRGFAKEPLQNIERRKV
jgi:hypothetical protein